MCVESFLVVVFVDLVDLAGHLENIRPEILGIPGLHVGQLYAGAVDSLEEKVDSVDFTIQLTKRLVGGLIDFYKRYITDTDCDKGLTYHNEYVEQYKKLDAILNILNDIR